MILTQHILGYENWKHTKFQFNWSISSEVFIFKLILICKFQNVSCTLELFFTWLFIVTLTVRSFCDCHCFLFGNGTLLIHWTSAIIHKRFSLIHGRHLLGHGPQVVFRPCPIWTTMRSGNTIYELLYEFRLHCHLLGNLSIRKSTILTTMVSDLEKH